MAPQPTPITPPTSTPSTIPWMSPGPSGNGPVRDLEAIIEGVSEEDKEALAEFTSAYDALMVRNWDRIPFKEFDEWVRTEGDCNRSDASLDDLNRLQSAALPP